MNYFKKRQFILSVFIALILSLLTVSTLIVRAVRAAATDTVNATVTAVIYAVSMDNGDGIAFGNVGQGTTMNSTSIAGNVDDSTTATNDGSVASKFNIQSTYTTSSGIGWTLADTPGSETYGLDFCITDCDSSPSWIDVGIASSYVTLAASINATSTQVFDLQVETPTSTVDINEQTIVVTVQAVSP